MGVGAIVSIFFVGFCLGFVVAAYIYRPTVTFLSIDREAAERRIEKVARAINTWTID